MQNRSGYDQIVSLLLSVRSKKDIAAILASVREQHGEQGVEIINQLLTKARENAEAEFAELQALSAICDRAESEHPNDVLKQARTARRGIAFFANSKNRPAKDINPEPVNGASRKHSM